MSTFKITQNGKDLKTGLSKQEALDQLFVVVEDFTNNNFVFDPENNTIKSPSGQVIAKQGDENVQAGDDYFEIEIENED